MSDRQFMFFAPDDSVLFVRNDAIQAEWTHQEFAFSGTFPFDKTKEITRGMRVGFADAFGHYQLFEVRNVRITEPDHTQDITAEHIIISELTDRHLMEYVPDDIVTAQTAVTALLTGTGWSLGTCTSTATHKPELSMTNVWSALTEVRDMMGLRLEPYVTVSDTAITGRYLNVVDNVGVWRGVRLAINKNISQVGVTYNDTGLVTAVYGYGAALDEDYEQPADPNAQSGSGSSGSGGTRTASNGRSSRPGGGGSAADREEYGTGYVTIKPVVWTQTDEHPAKPSGQMYLEDPEATALYGRNGTPRFGFYSNPDVDDPDELIELCWEALKRQNKPSVTIDCTCSMLENYGLAGEHIQIGDTVRVDVEPIGAVLELMCICLTEDLLNPAETRPTIGKYIKDIVYITKEQENAASGGGGGGGGGGANEDEIEQEKSVYTNFERTDEYILLQAVNIQKVEGVLNSAWSEIYQTASEITAEVTRATGAEATLSSRISINADNITAEVTRAGNAEASLQLTLDGIFINGTTITIKGQHIYMSDYVTVANLEANYATITSLNATDALISDLRSGNASFTLLDATNVSCDGIATDSITVNGEDPMKGIKSFGAATASGGQITIPTTCLDYTSGPSINFNIADTQFYQDGVSAAYNAGVAEFSSVTVDVANTSNNLYLNQYNNGSAIELFTWDGTNPPVSAGLHRWYWSTANRSAGYYAPYSSISGTYYTRRS